MTIAQAHSQLEERVAQRYREAGYEVFLNPEATMIPFDLGRYRPDILARKDALNLILEVKSTLQTDTSYERLRDVIEQARRHEGWRFVLVTEQDSTELPVQEQVEQTSWEEVKNGIANAQRLKASGETQAAYMLLWIAFEQALRQLSVLSALPLERHAPAIMLRQLYSEGVLSMSQFDVARSCLGTRNLVVHGFKSSDLNDAYGHLEMIMLEIIAGQPGRLSEELRKSA